MHTMILYSIALKMIPGIGDITAKKLIAFCGSPEAVFKEKRDQLRRIPGIGHSLSSKMVIYNVLQAAEKEIDFIERNGIRAYYYEQDDYPTRLKQCIDGPIVLFARGSAELGPTHAVAVVGTRQATAYGKRVCQELIAGLKPFNPLIISGLAYGIDTVSHKVALDLGLPTVAVLAHGLDRIYPPPNASLARKMLSNGALVSDFCSGANPDRENFPKRNRIIAGLADAIVVVEAARGGGALITAGLGNSYNRDVFAIPGRWKDPLSEGCNYLICSNRAALISSPGDLPEMMNWVQKSDRTAAFQTELLINLDQDEELVVKILQEHTEAGIDLMSILSGFSFSKLSSVLLKLELKNVLKVQPGKRYILAK